MRITVIGCGYLGAVHAACLARLGHEVVGIDVDTVKVADLAAGRAPFFEPRLSELLAEVAGTGRLTFTTDMSAAAGSQVHFVCVGTPQAPDGHAADLRSVDAAFAAVAAHVAPRDVVVGKSTVPVGTAARLAERLSTEQPDAVLAWNPEFLREGFAVRDTLHPDRLVYGVPAGDRGAHAADVLDEVYAAPISEGTPRMVTDYATAELVKVAANSFLATKISFINAMAELCDVAGADVTQLADAIGTDDRIGRRFLDAGAGFGGGCLPKDIRAFMARATELGAEQSVAFLREIDSINLRARARVVRLSHEVLGGDVTGRRVVVLGAAFKPGSDDVRDSPALDVAAELDRSGAHVVVTDPEAVGNARRTHPGLAYEASYDDAVRDADLLVLVTEWQQYRELDPHTLRDVVAQPRMVDARNVLDPAKWRAAGWEYRSIGRP